MVKKYVPRLHLKLFTLLSEFITGLPRIGCLHTSLQDSGINESDKLSESKKMYSIFLNSFRAGVLILPSCTVGKG